MRRKAKDSARDWSTQDKALKGGLKSIEAQHAAEQGSCQVRSGE